MKRITSLTFLCPLLLSVVAVIAMAYSIVGVLDAHDFSLMDTLLANKIPGCGNCVELKPTQDTPPELLANKIPACGNCLALKPAKITPYEILGQRSAGCGSCEDEGDPEE